MTKEIDDSIGKTGEEVRVMKSLISSEQDKVDKRIEKILKKYTEESYAIQELEANLKENLARLSLARISPYSPQMFISVIRVNAYFNKIQEINRV